MKTKDDLANILYKRECERTGYAQHTVVAKLSNCGKFIESHWETDPGEGWTPVFSGNIKDISSEGFEHLFKEYLQETLYL